MAMVTIMVADEFGENVPVGWCLSNCEDGTILSHFFNAIKKKIGVITVNSSCQMMQNSFIQPGNLYYFRAKVTVYLACMSIEHGDTTSSLLKVEIYKLIKV